MDASNPNPHDQILERAIAQLGEHFESVRIFVTVRDGAKGTTTALATGGGNYHAQLGQVREWLWAQEQFTKTVAHAQQVKDMQAPDNE